MTGTMMANRMGKATMRASSNVWKTAESIPLNWKYNLKKFGKAEFNFTVFVGAHQ